MRSRIVAFVDNYQGPVDEPLTPLAENPTWSLQSKARLKAMGDLIPFRPSGSALRSTAPCGSAKILFFTGVRYERLHEEPEAARPPDAPHAGGKSRLGRNRRRRGV
jgi:hypothetical protein